MAPPAPTTAERVAQCVFVGVALAGAVRLGLFGAAGIAVARWGHGPDGLATAVARCAGAVSCAFLAAFAWKRVPRRAWELAVVLAPLLLGALATRASVRRESRPIEPFFGISPNARNDSWVDANPLRPRVRYRTNRHGFRGPDFDEKASPGIARVAVVGDSFVFGSGVEAEETLPRALARALAPLPVEVLNLGVQGNNLQSHLRMLRVARDHLGARVAVLALTLPNDLLPWDWQDTVRESQRVGPMTLAYAFFGDGLGYFLWESWVIGRHPREPDASALVAGVRTADALVRPGVFDVLVFPLTAPTLAYGRAVDGARAARPVAPPRLTEAQVIPGDGHPTALGHRAYADALAPAVRAALGR